MADRSRSTEITRVAHDAREQRADHVAVEEPLEIQVASATATGAAAKSVSITMRTPGDDEELAVGFLKTEGIIARSGDIESVDRSGEPDPVSGEQNVVRVNVADGVDLDLDRLTRHFYTTSSCGVCGKASLDALAVAGLTSLAGVSFEIDSATLVDMAREVRERQPVFTQTGGLHAAAAFGPDGEIRVVREDVGRHNATDKVVGALLEGDALPANELGLFVSGRASFELMQKALAAGMPLVVAVGAPSSLAVDTAAEYGMTLVGFLRDDNYNIYAGEERIV